MHLLFLVLVILLSTTTSANNNNVNDNNDNTFTIIKNKIFKRISSSNQVKFKMTFLLTK
jgi:hypothetical protein